MNVRLQGVYVYGGESQNQYVFRGAAQRRRRTRNATIILTAIFVVLLAWCIHQLYTGIASPSVATADTAAAQVQTVQPSAQSQAPSSAQAA